MGDTKKSTGNSGPQLPATFFTEKQGVITVANLLNDSHLLWRETLNADVGIDGQIEYVDDTGCCTGHLIAAQIKSGPSYLVGDKDHIHYFPGDKHREYWRNFPLPVILFIHDPSAATTYWADARQLLRADPNTKKIRIPRTQIFTSSSRVTIFETVLPLTATMPPIEILRELWRNSMTDPTFSISYLDLFCLGLTDICSKLYYSMDLVCEIVQHRAYEANAGVTIDVPQRQFLDGYVAFLASQNLVRFDYSDYLVDRDVRKVEPMFLGRLTPRGDRVMMLLSELTKQYRLVFEAVLVFDEGFRHALPRRLSVLRQIREILTKPSDEPAV